MLSFFLAGPPFLPSPQCIPGRREKKSEREKRKERVKRGASEPGCSPRSSQTASLLPASWQQSFQDSLHHYSSTFCSAKCHRFLQQQHLTYFLRLFYVYMCVLPVVVILFTSWREVRRGQDLLQVLQGALCAAESTLLSTPNSHYHFPTPCSSRESWPGSPWRDPGEDFCPALPWLSATVLSQTRPPPDFLPV